MHRSERTGSESLQFSSSHRLKTQAMKETMNDSVVSKHTNFVIRKKKDDLFIDSEYCDIDSNYALPTETKIGYNKSVSRRSVGKSMLRSQMAQS